MPIKKIRDMCEWRGWWFDKDLVFGTKMRTIAEQYEKAGKKIYRLAGADVPLAGHRNHYLTNILLRVIEEGWDFYPDTVVCYSDFQEAAARYEKRYQKVNYLPEDIMPIPGVSSGWIIVQTVLLDPGDEIVAIVPSHYMKCYTSYAMSYLGAKVVQVPLVEEEKWEPDLEKLRECISEKTRAIALDYPNNPTGRIHKVKDIVDIAGENDIPIISDELYGLIAFDGHVIESLAAVSGDVPVIYLTSFSKLFMAPGWRIGYMAFHDPEEKIADVKKGCFKFGWEYGNAVSCIPLPILVAATRALTSMVQFTTTYPASLRELESAKSIMGPMGESMEMVRKIQKRKDYSYKRISEIDGVSVVEPQATFYMFPRVEAIGKTWKTDFDFITNLFEEEQVVLNPGCTWGFNGEGHFRTIFYHDIETLGEIYNRLERFIKRHMAGTTKN